MKKKIILFIILMYYPFFIAMSQDLGDANQDGQIKLNDAIYALQVNSGIKTMENSITEHFIKDETDLITTNRKPVGMEHNILFNATNRYKVTYSGMTSGKEMKIDVLFDGHFYPLSPDNNPTKEKPFVVTIENLPNFHTQAGAWVGWTTRYLPPKKFIIEGYNVHKNRGWVTIADHTEFENFDHSFFVKTEHHHYLKLRFTFYNARYDSNSNNNYAGQITLSELFFIHPEAARPYSGLLPSNMWSANGKVGIDTKSPSEKFEVNGNIKVNGNIVSDDDICIGKCN